MKTYPVLFRGQSRGNYESLGSRGYRKAANIKIPLSERFFTGTGGAYAGTAPKFRAAVGRNAAFFWRFITASSDSMNHTYVWIPVSPLFG